MKKFLFMVMWCVALAIGAAAQESPLSELNKQIATVREEIRVAIRQNPRVYYQDEDNPTMNIERRLGNTRINREYYCPYHRGFRYHNDICGIYLVDRYHRPAGVNPGSGCPALSNNITGYPVWKKLVEKVVVTEQKEKEIADLKAKLQDLLDRRAIVARAEASMEKAAQEANPEEPTSNPTVIVLPKIKVSELYSKKEIRYNGYIIQME